MPATNTIQHLSREEIDIEKWNSCILKASNSLIYAYSFYLDAMCTNWSAIVADGYEMVMPLPWRKKWGFHYLYQPYFVPALGVFGNDLPSSTTQTFLNNVPRKFCYWDMDLNENSKVTSSDRIKVKPRTNFFLFLNQPYEVQFKNYKRLARRKLEAALENALIIQKGVSAEVIIEFYQQHYEKKHGVIPNEAYTRLIQAINSLPKKNYQTYLVMKQKEILAAYLILVDDHNVYSLIGGSTEEGKKYGAFYQATDAAIQDFSNTGKTFRFEGSDVEGIAFFNSQFGPVAVTYPHITMNNLPWPVRYMK